MKIKLDFFIAKKCAKKTSAQKGGEIIMCAGPSSNHRPFPGFTPFKAVICHINTAQLLPLLIRPVSTIPVLSELLLSLRDCSTRPSLDQIYQLLIFLLYPFQTTLEYFSLLITFSIFSFDTTAGRYHSSSSSTISTLALQSLHSWPLSLHPFALST